MAQMAQMAQGTLGNTKAKVPRQRSRKWCFTWNNYTDEEYGTLAHTFQACQYIFGKEVGENGTKHVQGFVEYKNPVDFTKMKKLLPKAHIEKAKGTLKQNFEYCSKEGNYVSNMDFRTPMEKIAQQCLEAEYKDVVWKDWQADLIKKIDEKPDKRKIHWYYEKQGNVGKSYLCKYLALTRPVIIADGKKDNIFHSIFKLINEGQRTPTIILLDIPRSNKEFVNYGAIEQIKNGCIYSGKYEGGMCVFPIPHVIIFANEEPDYTKMSNDRWDVMKL